MRSEEAEEQRGRGAEGQRGRGAEGQRSRAEEQRRDEQRRDEVPGVREKTSVTIPTSHHGEDARNTSAPQHLSTSTPLLLRPSASQPLNPSAPLRLSCSASFPWLFSARTDLTVFLGSAVVSLLALWIGARAGMLYSDTPDWAWVPAVLLIDVAHVWSTSFRVYLDTDELKRRPWLYSLVPLLGLAVGIALYSEGELVFWRALAYLAVFHFIR